MNLAFFFGDNTMSLATHVNAQITNVKENNIT